MLDVTTIAPKLQSFFTEQADKIACATQFVQRKSKLTGALFLQTLVFGFMHEPKASLTTLIETSDDLGVEISKQGLQERIQKAEPFLKQMFQASMALFRNDLALDVALLKQFSAILITDSTVLDVPEALQTEFPGCGGDGPAATIKLQLSVDLLHGNLEGVAFEPGRSPDRAYVGYLQAIQPGALYINDLGYFVLHHFQLLAEHKAYFLSRFDTHTGLFEPATQHALDLLAWLKAHTAAHFEQNFLVGAAAHLPCRVLAVRVPQEVADRRRHKARQTAQRKGRTPSKRHFELMNWSVFLTNVPVQRLTVPQALSLYPVRWQIELIFKLWKSHCALDRIAGLRRTRILVELYAKMIGIVITQFILAPLRWGERELSPVKAQRIIRHHALRLAQSLADLAHLLKRLSKLMARCSKVARKDKRRKRLSTYQKLERLPPAKHEHSLLPLCFTVHKAGPQPFLRLA
jgi:hypothetical protein